MLFSVSNDMNMDLFCFVCDMLITLKNQCRLKHVCFSGWVSSRVTVSSVAVSVFVIILTSGLINERGR